MNTLRITRRILTVVLVVGALSAPVAAASTFEERFPSLTDRQTSVGAETQSYPDLIVRQGAEALEPGPAVGPSEPASAPSAGGGFDWGDASIGAAAMAAIMAIATGVVLEVGRRRRPRPKVA